MGGASRPALPEPVTPEPPKKLPALATNIDTSKEQGEAARAAMISQSKKKGRSSTVAAGYGTEIASPQKAGLEPKKKRRRASAPITGYSMLEPEGVASGYHSLLGIND